MIITCSTVVIYYCVLVGMFFRIKKKKRFNSNLSNTKTSSQRINCVNFDLMCFVDGKCVD